MNTSDGPLLILGASARAAAFSALRAGLQPWCADLFGDADLRARCPCQVVARTSYPNGLVPLSRYAPSGPWLYTGGLENRRRLIHRLSKSRPLWGNAGRSLAMVRSPRTVAELLQRADIPCPATRADPPPWNPSERWLIKPLAGAGGVGIRPYLEPGHTAPPGRVHYQEWLEGEPCAALYAGDGARAHFLGATRQLVGEPWLHAAPFRYCGSLGPLPVAGPLRQALAHLGDTLARDGGLRGLFGVDYVLRDGVPWPVEVNPRYTASVEVLEYAGDFPALALHRAAFDPAASPAPTPLTLDGSPCIGKVILFARDRLVFPGNGPWAEVIRHPGPIQDLPAFADIPHAGQGIDRGAPVLTFFTRSDSAAGCWDALRQIAADLDRWLFGR